MMYKTFINFNEIVKKEAQNIPLVFGFVFKPPNYYIPDAKLEKTLEKILDQKRSGAGGGNYEDDFNFAAHDHVVQDYDDNRHQFDKDDEDSGDEDIDMDILADVRKAEEFATNQSHHRSNTQKQVKGQQKINIDEFKTEALDDLFGISNE